MAQGRDWVCWWRKAGYASIFINGERRKAWLPALCFVGGEYIRVWAIPDAKPTAKTTLRLTNWPNTYSNGGVCWGSGRVPTGLRPKDWEDAFLSSSFTSGESFKAKPHAITKYKSYGTLGYTLEALARPRH